METYLFDAYKCFKNESRHLNEIYDVVNKMNTFSSSESEVEKIINYLMKSYDYSTLMQSYERDIQGLLERSSYFIDNKEYEIYKQYSEQYEYEEAEIRNICMRYGSVFWKVIQHFRRQELLNNMLHISYTYLHNILDNYIVSLIELTLIFKFNILDQSDEDELLLQKVNKEKNSISFKSIKTKIAYFTDNKFDVNKEVVDDLIYFSEIRNALIHNNGFFNEINVGKLRETKYAELIKVGDEVKLSREDFDKWQSIVSGFVNHLNSQINVIYKKYAK